MSDTEKFNRTAPKLAEKIHDLVEEYRGYYPELVVVDIHVTYNNEGAEHNWVSHKFNDFDVTAKQSPWAKKAGDQNE